MISVLGKILFMCAGGVLTMTIYLFIPKAFVVIQNADRPVVATEMCTNKERVEHLDAYCRKHERRSLDSMAADDVHKLLNSRMYVDDHHKIIVCVQLKGGWTTWFNVLQKNLEHVGVNMSHTHMHTLDQLSPREAVERLRTYYKVMVVRHPLERLSSCYFDKFAHDDWWGTKNIGPEVLKLARPNAPQEVKQAGKGVTFEELVYYTVYGGWNYHVKGPYDTMCSPCVIKYDYIVKLETSYRDHPYVIDNHLSGVGEDVWGNARKQQYSKELNGFQAKLDIYRNVTDSLYNKLIAKRTKDFEQFGYDANRNSDGSVVTTCAQPRAGGGVCC